MFIISHNHSEYQDPSWQKDENLYYSNDLYNIKTYIRLIATEFADNVIKIYEKDPAALKEIQFDMELDDFENIHLFCQTVSKTSESCWDLYITDEIHLEEIKKLQEAFDAKNSNDDKKMAKRNDSFNKLVKLGAIMSKVNKEKGNKDGNS